MSSKAPWRYSESRPIRPFCVSDSALDETQFRVRDDEPFTGDRPWKLVLEPEAIVDETFTPMFRIAVDVQRLSEDTGLAASDLKLTILVRDPAVWRSERIAEWMVTEYPDVFRVPTDILRNLSGARGLRFVIQVSPARRLEPVVRRAFLPAHVVAARTFDIEVPSEGVDFPVELVDSSAFESMGLPKESVWAVRWHSEEFDQPVEQVLTVLINKDQGEKLLRLSGSDSVGALVWQEIAVEVFVEMSIVVFRSEPQAPQQEDGLLAKLCARLYQETGLDLDGLIGRAKDPLGAISYFRAHLQKGMELGARIRRINLAGRR